MGALAYFRAAAHTISAQRTSLKYYRTSYIAQTCNVSQQGITVDEVNSELMV